MIVLGVSHCSLLKGLGGTEAKCNVGAARQLSRVSLVHIKRLAWMLPSKTYSNSVYRGAIFHNRLWSDGQQNIPQA